MQRFSPSCKEKVAGPKAAEKGPWQSVLFHWHREDDSIRSLPVLCNVPTAQVGIDTLWGNLFTSFPG